MARTISQAELRNGSAGVMDALERGEEFVITRNGRPVGQLRPIVHGRELTSEEVIRLFAGVHGALSDQIRAEADALFGEDRIGA